MGALVVACMLAGAGADVASAASCNDTWTGGGGDHDWATAANWTAGVPIASSNVCLDNSHEAGSYTVDIDTYSPPLVANSITVGGSAGNLVTLAILGTGGGVDVGNTLTPTNQNDGGGVLPTGAITLGHCYPNVSTPATIIVTAGTLVNQGTITSVPTGPNNTDNTGQNNVINGSFDNAGTLNLQQDFAANGPDVSSGTIDVATGVNVEFDYSIDGAGFTQTGGTIVNQGTFDQFDGTFTGTAGTSTGNPLLLTSDRSGVTADLAGTGTDSLHLEGGGALGSDIGPGYTLWASGVPGFTHGTLEAHASVTNHGTLELGSIDGTHGTLTVDSGTLTNDGTVSFENTANGPDGLNGSFVNDATVSVLNSFEGSGQITNNGSFAVATGASIDATSYAQGPGGTLSLAIAGGGTPVVPELRLTGAASLAGALAVSTAGTATGTFPVIADGTRAGSFGATHFTGENYAVGYTSGGVSLTGPAAASSSPPPPPAAAAAKPTLHVGKIAGGSGAVKVTLSCSKGAGSCAKATIAATVTEPVTGKRLTAVTARSKKARARVKTEKVVITSAHSTLKAGTSKTVTLTLNAKGKALVARFHKLATVVTVTANGKTVKHATVTVKTAVKKRPRR